MRLEFQVVKIPSALQQQILNAQQVQLVIEQAGKGASLTQKVQDIANRTGANPATLYSYKTHGAKKGPLNVLLCVLAAQEHILPLPDDAARI